MLIRVDDHVDVVRAVDEHNVEWKVDIVSDDVPDRDWRDFFGQPSEATDDPPPSDFFFIGRAVHFTCLEREMEPYKNWLHKYVDHANRKHAELVAERERKQTQQAAHEATQQAKMKAREAELHKKYPRKGIVKYKPRKPKDDQPDAPPA